MKYSPGLILAAFLVSCNSSPESKFEKFGVSFTCPEGWKITDQENLNNKGYYLSIEKDGFGSSGLMTISWANDSIDLNQDLEIYQNSLKNNIIYKNSVLDFDQPFDTVFNADSSIASKFKVTLLSVKHEGIMYCFYKNGKTITIIKQEAVEDKKENKNGFDIIEKSFSNI
jgi:hypothetical protein